MLRKSPVTLGLVTFVWTFTFQYFLYTLTCVTVISCNPGPRYFFFGLSLYNFHFYCKEVHVCINTIMMMSSHVEPTWHIYLQINRQVQRGFCNEALVLLETCETRLKFNPTSDCLRGRVPSFDHRRFFLPTIHLLRIF